MNLETNNYYYIDWLERQQEEEIRKREAIIEARKFLDERGVNTENMTDEEVKQKMFMIWESIKPAFDMIIEGLTKAWDSVKDYFSACESNNEGERTE
jgi:hypothetical protein